MYVGVVPLLLAGLAFRRKWRDSAWFLLALGVLGLLIALGNYTPILSVDPFFAGTGRIACARTLHPADNFSLAALAAIGLQRFMTEPFTLKRVLGGGLR